MLGRAGKGGTKGWKPPLIKGEKLQLRVGSAFWLMSVRCPQFFFNDFDFPSFWVTYGDFMNFHHPFPWIFPGSPRMIGMHGTR